jgi:hypothetical protein
MVARRPVDETPSSAFVREMKAALAARSQASTNAQRRRVDSRMLEIMRKYLGPGALRAAADAHPPMVARASKWSQRLARRFPDGVDPRALAAGERDE